MRKLLRTFVVAALVSLLGVPVAFASGEGEDLDPVHHTADGYYLDFEPIGTVELPRIFLVKHEDGSIGFDVYGSTASALRSGAYLAEFEEGHDEVEHGESEDGAEAHGQDAGLEALIASKAHLDAHLVSAHGSVILDFSITRHLAFALLSALIVVLIFTRLAARYRRGIGRETAPKGLFQNLFETLVIFVRDDIAKPSLGDHYKRFLPYLLTVFFFILTCNLLGMVPFGATATSNLMITAVLATSTFILTQFNGSKNHWRHVFWPPGVPVLVKPILIPVEIMGLFTKPTALAIRLFANMTAGHLVILSMVGLIFTFTNIFGRGFGWGMAPVSIGFALFVSLLEVLIACIQAYIFTMLSALFIGMAVAEHEHEEHEAAHAPALAEARPETAPPILGDGVTKAAPEQAPTLAPVG